MNEHSFHFCTPKANIICKSIILQFFKKLNINSWYNLNLGAWDRGKFKTSIILNIFPFSKTNSCFFHYFLHSHKTIVCVFILSHSAMSVSHSLMDYSPPGSSIHGILQARMLQWVAISSSKGSSWPMDQTESPASPTLTGRFFTTELPLIKKCNSFGVYWLRTYPLQVHSLPLESAHTNLQTCVCTYK